MKPSTVKVVRSQLLTALTAPSNDVWADAGESNASMPCEICSTTGPATIRSNATASLMRFPTSSGAVQNGSPPSRISVGVNVGSICVGLISARNTSSRVGVVGCGASVVGATVVVVVVEVVVVVVVVEAGSGGGETGTVGVTSTVSPADAVAPPELSSGAVVGAPSKRSSPPALSARTVIRPAAATTPPAVSAATLVVR